MSQEDKHDRDGIAGTTCQPRGDKSQDKQSEMNDGPPHRSSLFLFLMTVPVELLLVLVLPHLFTSFLDYTSHNSSPEIFCSLGSPERS